MEDDGRLPPATGTLGRKTRENLDGMVTQLIGTVGGEKNYWGWKYLAVSGIGFSGDASP